MSASCSISQNTHLSYIHPFQCWSLFFISLPEVLAAPCLWTWPRLLRLWPTWPGHLAGELAPTSPPWRPHADMLSATLWTPTAWWDASPVAPTTASTWKPSAAQDTSQSAHIVDSHPVRTNTYMHTHKNIHTDAYLRVWGEGWMISLDNWKTLKYVSVTSKDYTSSFEYLSPSLQFTQTLLLYIIQRT